MRPKPGTRQPSSEPVWSASRWVIGQTAHWSCLLSLLTKINTIDLIPSQMWCQAITSGHPLCSYLKNFAPSNENQRCAFGCLSTYGMSISRIRTSCTQQPMLARFQVVAHSTTIACRMHFKYAIRKRTLNQSRWRASAPAPPQDKYTRCVIPKTTFCQALASGNPLCSCFENSTPSNDDQRWWFVVS